MPSWAAELGTAVVILMTLLSSRHLVRVRVRARARVRVRISP